MISNISSKCTNNKISKVIMKKSKITSQYSVKIISEKKEMRALTDYIGSLRILFFRGPPYYYRGTFEFEKQYMNLFIEADNACFVILLDALNNISGVGTGIRFDKMSNYFTKIRDRYKEMGIDEKGVFYIPELIVFPDHREKGLSGMLLGALESYGEKNNFNILSICHGVSENNENLGKVFESNGFIDSGCTSKAEYDTVIGLTEKKLKTHNHIFLHRKIKNID